MSNYFFRHVNYHSSMIYCGMVRVVGFDRQQPFYSINNPLIQVGSMLLRHVLYHHMKLAEGYSLIAELHQESEPDSVDIVVLDIPESESMAIMMNKQLSLYLSNYFFDAGMGKVFVKSLIQGEIFPPLNHAAGTCKWDSNKKKFTTSDDPERERQQVLKDVSWYKDEYASRMSTKGRQKKNNMHHQIFCMILTVNTPSK